MQQYRAPRGGDYMPKSGSSTSKPTSSQSSTSTAPAAPSRPSTAKVATTTAAAPSRQLKTSPPITYQSSYPWESVVDGIKAFTYILINTAPDVFSAVEVQTICAALTAYIKRYVYPSWRVAVQFQIYTPPSQTALSTAGITGNAFIQALPLPGSYIPVVLIKEFGSQVPSAFATAIHGNVSGTAPTGYNASVYVDNDTLTIIGPFPYGTPFIVIPSGSTATSNGVNALMASNQNTKQGPTDFWNAFSLLLSQQVIAVLLNPSAAGYVSSGNPLGNPHGGPLPSATTCTTQQLFLLKDATAPFQTGQENAIQHQGWTFTNFALPAYFMPHSAASQYDLLARTTGPFIPYKGTQFVIYQEDVRTSSNPSGVLSDLQVGSYISHPISPGTIQFVSAGSIYTYAAWGMQLPLTLSTQSLQDVLALPTGVRAAKAREMTSKQPPIAVYKPGHVLVFTNTIAHAGRSYSTAMLDGLLAKGEPRVVKTIQLRAGSASSSSGGPQAVPTKPVLLPFQFVDEDGAVAVRITILNYIPSTLPPAQAAAALPLLQTYLRQVYLPYWNVKPVLSYQTIATDANLPAFDGSFIPIFLLPATAFDTSKLGYLPIAGGVSIHSNVPNITAGPLISEYLKPFGSHGVPALPLGNPYVLIAETSFSGYVTITTSQPGLGPFIGIPTGATALIQPPPALPYSNVGVAVPSSPATVMPLPAGLMVGKIGICTRSGPSSSLVAIPDMENTGAVTTVFGSPSGAPYTVPGPSNQRYFSCMVSTDACDALAAAVTANPDLVITIAPTQPSSNDLATYTTLITHAAVQLATDPSSAQYVLTSNPTTDSVVVFSKLGSGDATEGLGTTASDVGTDDGAPRTAAKVSGFVLPSYFIPNLRTTSYDNSSTVAHPLIPISRQETLIHVRHGGSTKHTGVSPAQVLGLTEGGFPDLVVSTSGANVFDDSVYGHGQAPGTSIPVPKSLLASVYRRLETSQSPLLL